MSGIAGIVYFDGAPVAPGQIEKMTAAMASRGPDGIQHWVKGSVALGQCMLRTTPESLEENQPLANEDSSLVLVMDGRVDNWEELRKELLGSGAVLRDRSDAELVLKAFQIWGAHCLTHIDGDFALVIWDTRNRSVFCARDRIGNKPFNYYWDGKVFAFASELHAIRTLPGVSWKLNDEAFADFMVAQCNTRDETVWVGIKRLVAANFMVVDCHGAQLNQYWLPDLAATLPCKCDQEYVEYYRMLLADSVRRMSRSQCEVACEVSGGLDSSAIYCMAEHLRRSGSLNAPGIAGYTLQFDGDPDADELAYARAVGEHLNTKIHEVPPYFAPLSWYRDWVCFYHDFPGFPNGAMSQGLVRQASQAGSRVIFNGAGGDEWLEGCRLYYAEELAGFRWTNLQACYRADASAYGSKQAMKWLIRYGIFPLLPTTVRKIGRNLVRAVYGGKVEPRYWWLTQAVQHKLDLRGMQRSVPAYPRVRWAGQLEQLRTLYNYPYADWAHEATERQYAALGVEVRRPLWSAQLVQFAFSSPERLRMRGEFAKMAHRQAMEGLMPNLVLSRMTKADFSVVFHRRLGEIMEILTKSSGNDLISKASLDMLFQCSRKGDGDAIWALWGLYRSQLVLSLDAFRSSRFSS